MTTFEAGDVVLLPFPFTNQAGTKKRPAVVVSSTVFGAVRPDLVVLAATSRLSNVPTALEYILGDWQQAGLPKPSMCKPVLLTIERALVVRKLGRLSTPDWQGVRRMLSAMLAEQ